MLGGKESVGTAGPFPLVMLKTGADIHVHLHTCAHTNPRTVQSFKYSFLKTVVSRRIGDFAPFRRGEPETYRSVRF